MDLIFASRSPRRRDFMNMYLKNVKFVSPDLDESEFESESPVTTVMTLAFEKALKVAKEFPDAVVLAADTIVYVDGEKLGKPKDDKDAFEMLKKLSGRKHNVLTGMALICLSQNKKRVEYVTTEVEFTELSDDMINGYIKTGEPSDKAGAYAIQGKGGVFVKEIRGSHSNVIGLPVAELDAMLRAELGHGLI